MCVHVPTHDIHVIRTQAYTGAYMHTKFLTKQQILDTVRTKLRAQGARSAHHGSVYGTVCAYRSGDLKCAIGHLIPDDLYCKEIEDTGVASDSYDSCALYQVLQESGLDMSDCDIVYLLTCLQRFHDMYLPCSGYSPEEFDELWEKHRKSGQLRSL